MMSVSITITPEALEAIDRFQLPEDLTFGKVMCPVMVECNYADGKWGENRLLPYHPLVLDPTCKVLHYGQEIFEGMKAYRVKGHGPYLFRPHQNQERFNASAERMAMPPLPSEIFMEGVEAMVSHCAEFIPQNSGDALYIRPFMFATDCHLGIKLSKTFKFMIVASPSAVYFTGHSLKVLIEREAVRACPGGVGGAKTGGNYASSLLSTFKAEQQGFHQILWLDAVEKKYVEEISVMNFFAVYGEEKVVTPQLTTTILDGITRKSLLQLAEYLGMEACQESLDVEELIADIKAQKCTEAFSCGTATTLMSIEALGEINGESYPLKHSSGPVSQKLRENLLGLQEGRLPDPFDWRYPVSPQLKR